MHRLATSAANAARAKQFVDWVKKEWLTEGGTTHPNIAVFDFYGLTAELSATPAQGQTNCLKYAYEGDHSSTDSHPNDFANQTVGPLFAQAIVDAISSQTQSEIRVNTQSNIGLKIAPNPATPGASLRMIGLKEGVGKIQIFDINGKMVFTQDNVTASSTFSKKLNLAQGVYTVRWIGVFKTEISKFVIQ